MGRSNVKIILRKERATVEYYDKNDAELAASELQKREFEEQKMEIILTNSEKMPHRRHEIKKNYHSKYRQFNNKHHRRQ